MSYSFRKQRFCHLSETGSDRKRTHFLIISPPTSRPAAWKASRPDPIVALRQE